MRRDHSEKEIQESHAFLYVKTENEVHANTDLLTYLECANIYVEHANIDPIFSHIYSVGPIHGKICLMTKVTMS